MPAEKEDPETAEAPMQEMVVAASVFPPHLPIVPLPSRLLFPKTVAPIVVTQPALVELVETG